MTRVELQDLAISVDDCDERTRLLVAGLIIAIDPCDPYRLGVAYALAARHHHPAERDRARDIA